MNASQSSLDLDRLQRLQDYRILNTPPESEYDDLVQMAALVCQTPIALISFMDRDRHWVKASVGLNETQIPRAYACCTYTVLESQMLEVTDLREDSRFAQHAWVVAEEGVRFYAGIPLVTEEGIALGTLCVLDRQPRTLTPPQHQALVTLSRQVMAQLNLRHTRQHLAQEAAKRQRVTQALTQAQQKYDHLMQSLNAVVWEYDLHSGCYRFMNPAVEEWLGYPLHQWLTEPHFWEQCLHETDRNWVLPLTQAALAAGQSHELEYRLQTAQGEVVWIHDVATIMVEKGEHIGIRGMWTNITESKTMAAQVQAHQQRLSLLMQQTPVAVMEWDLNWKIKSWNPAAEQLFGYSAGDNDRSTDHPSGVRGRTGASDSTPDGTG
ncbi:MAG: PAS domain-containing protein [Prochlorothrix sp.]|nr:PAS domain-containing protein [Prochlorothrix sp.]